MLKGYSTARLSNDISVSNTALCYITIVARTVFKEVLFLKNSPGDNGHQYICQMILGIH